MADGNGHPFNSDAIAGETIVQIQSQQQPVQKSSRHKELIDLLSSNNTSNHFLNSTDPSVVVSSHSISDDDFTRLKSLIRSTLWPVDHHIRRQLWMNILTLTRVTSSKQHRSHQHPSTTLMLDNNSSLSKHVQWPSFVDSTNLCFYHLNEHTGRLTLQRILIAFTLQHPDLTYCPSLQPFSCLLLHYFNEHEVLYLINRLLTKQWLCGETRLQWEANCQVFKKLLRIYYKSTADAIDLRYTNTREFYQDWFWWIFRYLPFSYIVKVMDCFFLEGPKILYRIAMALVHLFMKTVKHDPTGETRNMAEFCQHISVSIEQLLHIAFQIRNLKRSTIEQLIDHEEKMLLTNRHQQPTNDGDLNNNNNNNNTTHGSVIHPERSFVTAHNLTRIPKGSILDHQQFLILWSWLPARFSLSQPVLVFTTQEHGFRLQTLLEKVDEIEYSILVIRTTNGEVFGAFCAGLWSERHHKTYFGFGESFLFTLLPAQIKYSWVGQQQQSDSRHHQLKRELFLFVNQEKLLSAAVMVMGYVLINLYAKVVPPIAKHSTMNHFVLHRTLMCPF